MTSDMEEINMLEKKTAVVTGAAKGIGRAVALRLAQEGCHIVLNYRSQVSEELVEQIKSFGVECLPNPRGCK